MAIVQSARAYTTSLTDTALSVSLATAPTTGRLVIAHLAIDKNAGTISVGSGWSIAAQYLGNSTSSALAYRIADGTATDRTCAWTWVNGHGGAAGIVEEDTTGLVFSSGSAVPNPPNDSSVTSISTPSHTVPDAGLSFTATSIDSENGYYGDANLPTYTNGYTLEHRSGTINDPGIDTSLTGIAATALGRRANAANDNVATTFTLTAGNDQMGMTSAHFVLGEPPAPGTYTGSAASVLPAFTQHAQGQPAPWVARLTVTDDAGETGTVLVTVPYGVEPLVASFTASPNPMTRPLSVVSLDGSASTGPIASYRWELVSAPASHTGTFSAPTAATTTFTPRSPADAVAWWDLATHDGSTTVADLSGNGFNLSVLAGATWGGDHYESSASGGMLSTATHPTIGSTAPFTAVFVVATDFSGTDPATWTGVQFDTNANWNSSSGWAISYGRNTANGYSRDLWFGIGQGQVEVVNLDPHPSSATAVAGMRDASGVSHAWHAGAWHTQGNVSTDTINGNSLVIGRCTGVTARFYGGAIFDRVLTVAEVESILSQFTPAAP